MQIHRSVKKHNFLLTLYSKTTFLHLFRLCIYIRQAITPTCFWRCQDITGIPIQHQEETKEIEKKDLKKH